MRLFKKTLLILCMISIVLCAFASCQAKESLRLSADKTTAKQGEVVIFNTVHVTMKGESNAETATYEITAGSKSATLDGNKLTISSTAKNGDVITVVAKMGDMVSNSVSITVIIPQNTLSISTAKPTAQRGEIVTVNVTLTEDGNEIDSAKATLAITKGSEFAKLVGTKLTINEDAADGSEIELTATYKNLTSNKITITVSVPVTGITVSANKSFIPAGSFVQLQKTLTPAGLVADVEWVVIEGADLCTVSGDMLAVNADATDGATIKVKAKYGNVESNVLTFTVGEETETFLLMLSQNKLTVDRNGTSATLLDVEILNGKLEPVTDRTVEFEIISGAEYLSLDANGNVCTFTALGHGEAVLRVSLPGTNIFKTANIKVIVPPEAIKLPEMFVERLGHTYSFSMINPGTGEADRIPFDAVALGENACTTLKYTFVHEDGTSGDDVAVWADGKITFKKQGRVTVTVSSDSGSRNEVTNAYSFQVNVGYNVGNYTDLKNLLESDSYNGEIVNIVVTEKVTGANGYEYGYALVPPAALKVAEEQTWQDVFWYSSIHAKNKNVYLNGNRHKIDGSQLRVVSRAEIDELNNLGHSVNNIGALLMISPEAADPMQIAGRQHSVKVFDLEVVGNTPINFDGPLSGHRPMGCYNTGLCIGNIDYDVVYHVEVKNITASRFNVGMRFRHAVGDSSIDNLNVYNCFSNGIEVEASILNFGDLTFGKCGAAGLEMVPTNSDRAGDKMDQRQTITFAGVIDTSNNLNKGDSPYFNNYKAGDFTVPMILQGVLQQYQGTPSVIGHMMNEQGEFGFVTFIFHDFTRGTVNQSDARYPAYQQGGIINANDLPKDGSIDTTHEYILLEIKLANYGLDLGYALLYNHNYQPK